jgi:hypothetical protein
VLLLLLLLLLAASTRDAAQPASLLAAQDRLNLEI